MLQLHLEQPSPRQREFLRSRARFTAYGGARGGGKSWAVRQKALLLALRYPGIRILLLRRSYPELRENHILPLRRLANGAADYREGEKSLMFTNGSRLKFGYCANPGDVLRYQGQEYDAIFLDEATHFTEYQFSALTACIRGANDYPKRMYLTCNPGGPGHQWVKRLFVDRDFRAGENPADYLFIPALVYDNRALLEKDPGYVELLQNLPQGLREAWLEGRWDQFEGQFFPEFRRETHVCRPFEIPKAWRRYFAMDYGLDMLAGYFIAVDQEGAAWVYQEVYESGLIVSQAAERILACGQSPERLLAPPDLWNRRQDTGRSAAEIFAQKGLWLEKAENRRASGWLDLKEWLAIRPAFGGPGRPWLKIFDCCPNLIRSLEALRFAPDGGGDAATQPHEITHGPDALRYFAAGRPCPASQTAPRQEREDFHFKSDKEKNKIFAI